MSSNRVKRFYIWLVDANSRLCQEFGGEHKIINDNALQYSVTVPWASFFNVELYPQDCDKLNAFAKQFGHPFLDGNKRTLLAAIEYLCNLFGWSWDVPLATKYQYIMQMAGANTDSEITITEDDLQFTPYIWDLDEIIEETRKVMECLSNPNLTYSEE